MRSPAASCQPSILSNFGIFAIPIIWNNISVEFCFSYEHCWTSFYIFEGYLSFWGESVLIFSPLFSWPFCIFFQISGGFFYTKWLDLCACDVSCKYIFTVCYLYFEKHIFIAYIYIISIFLLLMNFESFSLIHLEFILVYGVRYWSSFIFFQVSIQLSQHYLKIHLILTDLRCHFVMY